MGGSAPQCPWCLPLLVNYCLILLQPLHPNLIPPKAPAATGAFYFFNNYQSTKNDPRYLAPSSTSAHKLEPLYLPKQISNNSTHSKAVRLHISPLLIHLFPQRIYQILRSLSPSRMPLPPHQREGDELRRHLFCGAPEEGVGEVLGERGGYGSGFGWWLL